MAHEFVHPIIGQEAICGDGLGRVMAFEDNFPRQWIQVRTYEGSRDCKWAPHNVKLIPITAEQQIREAVKQEREACAKWFKEEGWMLDPDDVPAAIVGRK